MEGKEFVTNGFFIIREQGGSRRYQRIELWLLVVNKVEYVEEWPM